MVQEQQLKFPSFRIDSHGGREQHECDDCRCRLFRRVVVAYSPSNAILISVEFHNYITVQMDMISNATEVPKHQFSGSVYLQDEAGLSDLKLTHFHDFLIFRKMKILFTV